MSITIKTAKIIAMLSFLIINGIQEDGVPNFALLLILLFQFLGGIVSGLHSIFWDGLIVIPILIALIVFLKNKNFKVILVCFVILVISLISTTGMLKISNFSRIDFLFIFLFFVFLTSSIFILFKTYKQNKLV